MDQAGLHGDGEDVAGVVGVDRLLEAPEQLLRGAVLADHGLPHLQRAVLDDRGEQELAAAGEQQLEALVLDDVVVLDGAEVAQHLAELRAGGTDRPQRLEPAQRRSHPGVAQDLREDVLDLLPRAVQRHGGEDPAADLAHADHLAQRRLEVDRLAEHEVGDDEVVAVVGHRGDVVEVAGLEVDAVLPLGADPRLRHLQRALVGIDGEDLRAGAQAVQKLARPAPGPAVDVQREDLGQVGQVADDEPREAIVPDREISRSSTRATLRSRSPAAPPPRLSCVLKGWMASARMGSVRGQDDQPELVVAAVAVGPDERRLGVRVGLVVAAVLVVLRHAVVVRLMLVTKARSP